MRSLYAPERPPVAIIYRRFTRARYLCAVQETVHIGNGAAVGRGRRRALIAFGWLNVGLGVAGTVLPLLPTTVFLLVALWAFSKSSPRLHDWLYNHPRFGPALGAWRRDRAIPFRAKLWASAMLAASLVWLGWFSEVGQIAVAVLAPGLAGLGIWIVTRPTAADNSLGSGDGEF